MTAKDRESMVQQMLDQYIAKLGADASPGVKLVATSGFICGFKAALIMARITARPIYAPVRSTMLAEAERDVDAMILAGPPEELLS